MTVPDGGLLIVNADDWGFDEITIRAISACHRAGGVSSTTAMMFMRGSKLGASAAMDHPELGVGLHLNLVEEYTDPAVPAAVRARQSRMIGYFRRRRRLRGWFYDPRVGPAVDAIVADQLGSFVDLYGRWPTHIDGHLHCHLAANVLFSPVVPRGTKVRNGLSLANFPNPIRIAGRHPVAGALGFLRKRAISRRLCSTDYLFLLNAVWPGLEGGSDGGKLELARRASVEVMVHPAFPRDYALLRSREWVSALRGLPLGTFRDL